MSEALKQAVEKSAPPGAKRLRVREDAVRAARVHLTCLAREALERAAREAEAAHYRIHGEGGEGGDRGESAAVQSVQPRVTVELEHLTRIVPQLLLDF